ncbi:effector-associated domain EAD1-containing protein [Moorena producens JHB]|uniref:Effector-associated domain EAD1-containing protein n=1 Tax=Moorena producens (strain JHB) TaxID=1454205 RepID=A0A1D9FVD1_MOOP1|nr:effector-associated domain EAD1-containing protein [Moorena producens]AOY79291.1 effector-associated domain EAD1-containing protein [Moorena producens JHB]
MNAGHTPGYLLAQIESALCSAFPSKTKLEMMLGHQLNTNLEEVASGGNLKEIVYKVVQDFKSSNKSLAKLINKALQENPYNPDLKAIKEKFKVTTSLVNILLPLENNLMKQMQQAYRGCCADNLLDDSAEEIPESLEEILESLDKIPQYYNDQEIPIIQFGARLLETEDIPNPIGVQLKQWLYENAKHDLSPGTGRTGKKSCQTTHILHLSDLHITTPKQATLWSNQLAQDLSYELQIPDLDALILSGDIANYSTPEEYQAAQQFLDNLRKDFPLDPKDIVIVPGNHDLNWELAKEAYELCDRKKYQGTLTEGDYIEESPNVIRVRDETKYQQRFAHFSQFYQAIKGQPYPLDYDQQAIIDHFPEQNLLILGLNSAWELDHHFKTRASIHSGALSKALAKIRRNPDYRNCLKLAVWHHPLNSDGSDRITDQGFIEQLAVAGFRFFLHGHIHKAETSLFRFDLSPGGRKLDGICAGTFGAPTLELRSAYPWQYNLLKINDKQLTVHTRRREEPNGAWKPDSRWSQGPGLGALDYYCIEL